MKQFEQNVINSFQLAKKDIYLLFDHVNALYDEVRSLKIRNTQLTETVAELSLQATQKRHKRIAQRATKTAQRFVASKMTSKFHASNCAFAKNIKSKNKRSFTSKNAALNDGYKGCSCVA